MGRRTVWQDTQPLPPHCGRASVKLSSSSQSTAMICSWERLGMEVESRVSSLIRELLTPLTLEKLISHDRDLPHYAEAAPDEFLKLLEEDLRQSRADLDWSVKTGRKHPVQFIVTNRSPVGTRMPCLETPRARELDPCAVVGDRYQRQLAQQADIQPLRDLPVMVTTNLRFARRSYDGP